MNYLRTYCNLIRKAEQRGYAKKKAKELGVYVEGHHTFPVSIFGKNKRLVYLTAREHYVAHALLERICIQRYGKEHWKTYKMTNAHIIMGGRGKYKNSYIYEEARKRYSENRTGVPMKEESKLKLRNYRLGTKQSPEVTEIVRRKNTGKKRTQEQRDRMSRVQKSLKKIPIKIQNEDFRNKFIEAVKSSKTKGDIILKLGMKKTSKSSYCLITKWANFLNLDMSHLIGVHINTGKIRTKETREKMSLSRKGKIKDEEHKKKIKLSNCKYVYTFISPNGIITETILHTDFCKENNLNPCEIRKITRGIIEYHKGWKATRRPRTNEDK
jgi:hypothetical protein